MSELRAGFRTRGQPAATRALRAMLARGLPHAIVLAGPAGVGKTTLAEDIAAALLCRAPDPDARPCRACRACRAVEHGNHPDVHRLEPTGAGALIPIGGRGERGVRDLVTELALLPVEGGARVAIIAAADRMSEDAQSALLKTLEEPPSGVVLILCADDEERLLPTIRSRCARIRLGPVAGREIEGLLSERQLADPPLAARLGRLAGGRPGLAVTLSATPEALAIRAEIARTLLDVASMSRTERLRVVRDLAARAADLRTGPARRSSRGRGRAAAGAGDAASAADANVDASGASTVAVVPDDGAAAADTGAAARVPAAERRSAAIALVGIWRDVARDLVLAALGDRAGVRDLELLEELEQAAQRLAPAFGTLHLRRLERAGEQLEGNVSPELVLDVLALGWAA